MCDAAADYLGGGPGHPRAAPGGRLSVEGGGIAFWSPAEGWTGPHVAASTLRRIVAGPAGTADDRSPVGYRVLVFEGLDDARLVRFGFRLSAWDAPGLLSDLARERQRAGMPAIPGPTVPEPRDPAGCPRPSAEERSALPEGSLPQSWLLATAGGARDRSRHVDGMAMLLELAVRGLLDADRSRLIIGDGAAANAALDGALARLAADACPDRPEDAAPWLGDYVGGLAVGDAGRAELRARIAESVASGRAPDLRTALLVWLVKQDDALGRIALARILGEGGRPGRRALRRAAPDLPAGDDPDAAARAHRVLYAAVVWAAVPDY